MTAMETPALLEAIATEFGALPEVRAVALAGSRGGRLWDERSDLDLCVYAATEPPEAWRTRLAQKFGERISIGNHFWETGDEWVARQTGTVVDIMYRTPEWIEGQLDRVLLHHQASVGYSTCFVHNVLHSRALHDPQGWYAALQRRTQQPYPEELRRAVVAKNHPILRSTHSSYLHQLTLALARHDHVSVQHRVTALLVSCLDIVFAVNRLPHPGEKRLVAYVLTACPKRPPNFHVALEALLKAAAPGNHAELPQRVHEFLDGLDALLLEEGLLDATP